MLCVNPGGTQGCYKTIQAAINAVSVKDARIVVQNGTYTAKCSAPACSVATISSAAPNGASLVGLTLQCNPTRGKTVVLNAAALDHAIYVSGVNQTTIEGCVARNASREGILVENSNNVNVADNTVANNDLALGTTVGKGTPACPTFNPPGGNVIVCCPDAFSGGPGNFPEDNDDCGEGLHLRGVSNSVVQGNTVQNNVGGILISDETGMASNNLITGNTSQNNTLFGGDCGITLPSHTACTPTSTDATGCTPAPAVGGILQANGVVGNVVIGNVLRHNGASGTGIFANPGAPPGAATNASGNLISNNVVQNNGQPGIAIHVHAANGIADNNVIVGNTVSGNGGDSEGEGAMPPNTGIEVLSNGSLGAPFSPAAPIVGTIISNNDVSKESIDIWVGNNATSANIFLNDLPGKGAKGVDNAGTGSVTATDNWWGCAAGPGTPNCSSTAGTVLSSPFLAHSAPEY